MIDQRCAINLRLQTQCFQLKKLNEKLHYKLIMPSSGEGIQVLYFININKSLKLKTLKILSGIMDSTYDRYIKQVR